MTAVAESKKPDAKKQKDRREEDQVVKDVRVNDELIEPVGVNLREEDAKEREEREDMNNTILNWASQIKTVVDQMEGKVEESVVPGMLLTVAYYLVNSVDQRQRLEVDRDLEERREKDRELTEQDKDIMALVKDLQDDNLG